MKAAEAITVLGAAGSNYAMAEAELERRKKVAELKKEIAGGQGLIESDSAFAKKQAELTASKIHHITPVETSASDKQEDSSSFKKKDDPKPSSWDSSPLVPEVDEIPF